MVKPGFWLFSSALCEPIRGVAGLHDCAVMVEAIQQRGRHLADAKDRGPFAEFLVCGDDDAGLLIELGDQVE